MNALRCLLFALTGWPGEYCPRCHGTGQAPRGDYTPTGWYVSCPRCRGKGRVVRL